MAEVDEFVAPSKFLAGRLVAWGLPAERLRVLPNPIAKGTPSPPRVPDGRLVVGYFGQISMLKGIGVLLDAAALLLAEGRRDISFQIHGTMVGQPPELLDDLPARLTASLGNVRVVGPYLPEEVDRLMAGVDVVCVPSIWWENAPTVIAEARRVARRVVCSDLGGMREMAQEGDVLFAVGSSRDLVDRLLGMMPASFRTMSSAQSST